MINIIGAGPAGCYAGYLLAKSGYNVRIFEEHSEIGKPVQCTGLLTDSIFRLLDLDDSVIIYRLNKAKICYAGKCFETKLSEVVVDRAKFDLFLADKAKKAGCEILLNHQFIGINDGRIIVKELKNNKLKEIEFSENDFLIGADGPNSKVKEIVDKKTRLSYLIGIQARVTTKADKGTFAVHLDKAPGFFAWVVPEGKGIARIGLAAKNKTKDYFDKFIQSLSIQKKDILEMQGGLIPIYNQNLDVQKDNIYLLGDAAGQVKATTGGGIIPGLIASKCLAESIVKNKNYKALLNRRLTNSLRTHLKIRKILDNFTDMDFQRLIKLCNQAKVRNALSKTDRDNPIKLILSILISEPRFLLFLKNAVKA